MYIEDSIGLYFTIHSRAKRFIQREIRESRDGKKKKNMCPFEHRRVKYNYVSNLDLSRNYRKAIGRERLV